MLKQDRPSWWPYWKIPDILFLWIVHIRFTRNTPVPFALTVKPNIAFLQLIYQQQAAGSYFTFYISQTIQFSLSLSTVISCWSHIFSVLPSFLEIAVLTEGGRRIFLPPGVFLCLRGELESQLSLRKCSWILFLPQAFYCNCRQVVQESWICFKNNSNNNNSNKIHKISEIFHLGLLPHLGISSWGLKCNFRFNIWLHV